MLNVSYVSLLYLYKSKKGFPLGTCERYIAYVYNQFLVKRQI